MGRIRGGVRDQGAEICMCKVGGVGSESNPSPWIAYSAVRSISKYGHNSHSSAVWKHVELQ